jgi:hypothetical protein
MPAVDYWINRDQRQNAVLRISGAASTSMSGTALPAMNWSMMSFILLRFRRMASLQKFASVHANVHNHFNSERHLVDRSTFKQRRSAALAEWQSLFS